MRLVMTGCDDLRERVIACRRCPRLVNYREHVRIRTRNDSDEIFWRKPVPGYGELSGKLMILGLAPAASGGNRTGRVFTGDRSAQFLVSALYEAGFASQPFSVSSDDGLHYSGAYVTAAVKCAPPDNKPLRDELHNCTEYLSQEIACMPNVSAILALGQFAYGALVSLYREEYGSSKFPGFENGGHVDVHGVRIFMSYHPSPRNVNTGKLRREAFMGLLYEIRQYLSSNRSTTNNL